MDKLVIRKRRKPKTMLYAMQRINELNQKWFQGKLRYIVDLSESDQTTLAFVTRPDDASAGVHPECCRLHLTPKLFHLANEDFENILLHELCHVAQYYHGYTGGHGETMLQVGRIYRIPPEVLEARITLQQ